mgnify:CR=1 FL=1
MPLVSTSMDYLSSVSATDLVRDAVWSAEIRLIPEQALYIIVHYQPPSLPIIVRFILPGPLSSGWFAASRLKVKTELLRRNSKLFLR